METLRAFIAVDIGDEIRGKLDELQRKLKKVHSNVRWVNPRTIHLTLAFLGDIPLEQVDTIKRVLDQSATEQSAFELQAAGTGTFGKPKHPRVIWVGVAESPPLMKLQSRLVQELYNAKIEFDNKPFSPHLTLGRVKGIDRHTGPLLDKVEKYKEAPQGTTRIGALELIQSQLTPRGAEYTTLYKAKLP